MRGVCIFTEGKKRSEIQYRPNLVQYSQWLTCKVKTSRRGEMFNFIFNLRRSDYITDALISLHWLRVPQRITLKVAMLTYHALHGSAPPSYLASSFTCVTDMPHRHREAQVRLH